MPQSSYTPIQKKQLKWPLPTVLLSFFLLGLLIFTGERLVNSPWLQVHHLNITGQRHISSTAIRHLSDIRYKEHLLVINTTEAQSNIQQHPWIKKATVKRNFPSTVTIDIEEYQPVVLLALDKLWYIDKDGDIFRHANSDNINYPIVTGIPQGWVNDHPGLLYKTIQDALQIYDACKVPLIGSVESISEINFHPSTGFRVILRNGTILSLGFFDPHDRIERLRKMVAKGLDISIPQQIELDADKVAIAKPLTKLLKE